MGSLATLDALPQVLEIVRRTIEGLLAIGDPQWGEDYPTEDDFRKDIEKGELHVLEDEDKVAAFVCLNQWQSPEYEPLPFAPCERFLVIHRVAVLPAARGKGLGQALFALAESEARRQGLIQLRTDTHETNTPMNALMRRCGFAQVGYLRFLPRPGHFIAYQKLLG